MPEKKLFTVLEANAMLPLVRRIVSDITVLAAELRDRHEQLTRVPAARRKGLTEAHREERELVEAELERGYQRMQELERELHGLSIELKDYFTGLIDFPSLREGREVYLCWRLGEPEVGHWHEREDGFAGRQKLLVNAGPI